MTVSRSARTSAEKLALAIDSRFFRALSEPVRVQILKFLILNGRSDVGSIERNFRQDRSVISRHLQTMREAGILAAARQDRHTFYEVNAGLVLERMEAIVDTIRACIGECCPGVRG